MYFSRNDQKKLEYNDHIRTPSIINGIFQIRFGLEVKLEVQIGVEGMSTQMNNILLTNI